MTGHGVLSHSGNRSGHSPKDAAYFTMTKGDLLHKVPLFVKQQHVKVLARAAHSCMASFALRKLEMKAGEMRVSPACAQWKNSECPVIY